MKNLSQKFKNFLNYINKPEPHKFTLSENINENSVNVANSNKPVIDTPVSNILENNLNYIKNVYFYPVNSGFVIREFNLNINNKFYSAFLCYIEGLSDGTTISESVLKPLMFEAKGNYTNDLKEGIYNTLIPFNNVTKQTSLNKNIESINTGATAIFINGIDCAYIVDAKKFEHRTVSTPTDEAVIRGRNEAFTESIGVNTSIIRRIINNENLVLESTNIGKITKTNCTIAYMKNIVNDSLVGEVKRRLKGIDIDYLIDSRSA